MQRPAIFRCAPLFLGAVLSYAPVADAADFKALQPLGDKPMKMKGGWRAVLRG